MPSTPALTLGMSRGCGTASRIPDSVLVRTVVPCSFKLLELHMYTRGKQLLNSLVQSGDVQSGDVQSVWRSTSRDTAH